MGEACVAMHLVLVGLAAANYVMETKLDSLSRAVFFILGVILIYLFLTKGPPIINRNVPMLLRAYFWSLAVLMFVSFNIVFVWGYEIPRVPFRLVLLGVLIPFAILLRMRPR
jgi:hypothetical protein